MGAVLCIVLALISMSTAVILSSVAMDASSKVSSKPLDEFQNERQEFFDEPDCKGIRDSPPDRDFYSCLAEHEVVTQQRAGEWAAEVEGRQADIQTKGNLALVFGLAAVTLAVCAVAWKGNARTAPRPAGPAAAPGAQPGAPVPAQPPQS